MARKTAIYDAIFCGRAGNIMIPAGEKEFLKLSPSPYLFQSPVTYLDPSDENLPDEEDHDDEGDELIQTEKENEKHKKVDND